MSAAGAIVVRQNKYIRRFRNAEALSPETAKTLEELGIRESWTFSRMVGRGVFIEAGEGRYYMDPIGEDQFLAGRWMRIIATVIIGLIIVLLIGMRH